MYTIVKTLIVRDRHFTIVKNNEGYYLAIEDKYITNGVTNTKLNGFQMHASKDLNQCLQSTRIAVEMDYLKEHGKTNDEILLAMQDYILKGA